MLPHTLSLEFYHESRISPLKDNFIFRWNVITFFCVCANSDFLWWTARSVPILHLLNQELSEREIRTVAPHTQLERHIFLRPFLRQRMTRRTHPHSHTVFLKQATRRAVSSCKPEKIRYNAAIRQFALSGQVT